MAGTELTDAIKTAEQQLMKEIGDKGGTPPADSNQNPPEVTIEDEGDGESDDEPGTGDPAEQDLDDAQLEESKRLYKALRDPKTSGPIIAALAAQAGLHLTPASTKAEVKEVKKSIMEAVSEALGKEYEFLAPKLGKAFEAALEIQKQDHDASLQEIRQNQVERDVVTSYEKLARETKGESKALESKMAQLSEEVPIGNMTVDKYIRRLYSIAVAENQQSSARKVADKIRRNAGAAPERLRSGSAAGTEPKLPDKKMNLKDSVNFALDQLTKQGK